MTNPLAQALSPYLRQHAENPVDWREWSDTAFDEARRRDVPVLLSVGYAACHWCHVMAHESFDDAQVAAYLNENFVNIKVDREERPDIDAVYMSATQALTGHGGWPMTVFLTPEGAPVYAGTYFPRDQFLYIANAIAQIWCDDRDKALATGQAIVNALADAGPDPERTPLTEEALAQAVATLRHEFDDARGGFGGAPKFPPSMTLEHLLRHHARTGSPDALAMAHRTADAMARGGMYDQLDGGFARYSVDANWVVPHFEKMLYDNAQLLRVYIHLARRGDRLAERVARDTGHFLLQRLGTAQGAFASSLDADAAGVEGSSYVWTPDQLRDVLGVDDAERAARLFEVTPHGTFEEGASTLQMRVDIEHLYTAEELGEAPELWLADVRRRLLAARNLRPQPARDDKVVTAWNGLAIAALAEGARVLEVPEWLEAAKRAADFVLTTHVVERRLRRASLDGAVGDALAGADDYGDFAEGLLVLHQATGEQRWLAAASELLDSATELFFEGERVFDSGRDAEQLFLRPRSSGDNAEPSGASALASAFLMASALTGSLEHRRYVDIALGQIARTAQQSPRFAGWALACAEAMLAGPLQVAIVAPSQVMGDASSTRRPTESSVLQETRTLERATWMSASPGLVRVSGVEGAQGVPLLADRPMLGDHATAYVCRGSVCQSPVTDPDELARLLG